MKGFKECRAVYSIDGCSPTLNTMGGGNRQPKILLKSKDKRLQSLVNKTKFTKGEVLNMDLYNQTTNKEISQTLTQPNHNNQRLYDGLRIRKLTPKECWRLQGFRDEYFDRASQVCSNSQLYKQAGNSICVSVLEGILSNLIPRNAETIKKELDELIDEL